MFRVDPTAGILDQVGIGATFCDPGPYVGPSGGTAAAQCYNNASPYLIPRSSTGGGWGPDATPDSTYVDIASFSGTAGNRIFVFADGPDAGTVGDLEPTTEESDIFFVSYAVSDITFDYRTNIQFMISLQNIADGADFTQIITLVPEPATALMLGAGLAGIAFAGRRRR
jgi:hypothetical protein